MRIHTANRKRHPRMAYREDVYRRMGRRVERYRRRQLDMAVASLRPGLQMLADFMVELTALFQSPDLVSAMAAMHIAIKDLHDAAVAQGLLPDGDIEAVSAQEPQP